MRYSRSILNAFFVLALVPVAQASIYAMADGVNFNALARQKAQKRAAQQHHYRDLVRNPFRLFKRQEDNPGTPIPTLPPISNTSTTTAAETTTTDVSSSITTLESTSTDDGLSTTTSSTDAETTGPSETETTTDASSTTTEDVTSTTDTPSTETTTSSTDEPASETSTEVTSSTETTTIRTTLDTSVKSAFTTAWSTSTFTLPNGAVGTVTEYLVVVPTISPTRAQNPQESETATGTASLHTNAAGLYTPGPVPVVALMAVLGYVGGAAF